MMNNENPKVYSVQEQEADAMMTDAMRYSSKTREAYKHNLAASLEERGMSEDDLKRLSLQLEENETMGKSRMIGSIQGKDGQVHDIRMVYKLGRNHNVEEVTELKVDGETLFNPHMAIELANRYVPIVRLLKKEDILAKRGDQEVAHEQLDFKMKEDAKKGKAIIENLL